MKPPDARLADSLLQQTAAFATTVAGTYPDTKVPTCPDWRLRDLVAHIGQGPRWMAGIIRTGAPAPVPEPKDEDPGPRNGWPAWLQEGARELIAALDSTGPDTTVWTVIGPAPARFWLRRWLCDVVVHHADAAFTAGLPYTVPADLAAEAIDEGLELLGLLPGLRGKGETLNAVPTEPDLDGWLITRLPDRLAVERTSAGGDLVLSGSVKDLMLVFSRRLPPGSVQLTGDRALLDHWLANSTL